MITELSDRYNLVSGTFADGQARMIAADSTAAVRKALELHNTSPAATAALGRLLTGAMLMSCGLKNDTDSISLIVKGSGPIKGIVAISDRAGNVRGYCTEPHCDLPLNKLGKLDVGGAVGAGVLTVIKDLGLKEPYSGTVELVSGEIAEDLTYYFAASEQVPTALAAGVLVGPSDENLCGYDVAAAGGFMVQLMPGADESLIDTVSERISALPPVTSMINAGVSPKELCEDVLKDLKFELKEQKYASYRCKCSRARMEEGLLSLGKTELRKILVEDRKADTFCHFCNTEYHFSEADLWRLLKR